MDPPRNSVIGLSSLRPKEEPKKPKETEASNKKKEALNAYLSAAYGTLKGKDERKKSKKDKKRGKKVAGGLAIVDTDVDTRVEDMREDRDGTGKMQGDHDEDAPVVVNEGEFRRQEAQEARQKELAERTGAWKVVDASGNEVGQPRRVRHDTDEEDGDDDPSPPRRARHDSDDGEEDSDIEVLRRNPCDAARADREDSDEDIDEDSDADVPRRSGPAGAPQRMSDGSLAGMVTGQELMKEMAEKRKKDIEQFRKLDDSYTGRNAKTVYRTDDGRAVSKEEFERGMRDKQQQEKGYIEGADLPWGKGLRQAKGDVENVEGIEQRMPSRWDDPMGHILAKKKPGRKKDGKSLLDAYAKELRKAGFNVPLEVPAHSWLNRNIAPPPNRFNIKPGRHWDGVDRGQGFEAFVYKTLADKRQKQLMGHFMNQEDM